VGFIKLWGGGEIPRLVEELLAGDSTQSLDWKHEETRPAKLTFAVNAKVKF